MPTTRDYVQGLQEQLIALNAAFGVSAISDEDYLNALGVMGGGAARWQVQADLSASISKLVIRAEPGFFGVTEIFPSDQEITLAQDRLRRWGSYLEALREALPAPVASSSVAAQSEMDRTLREMGPLPDPQKVQADTFNEEVRRRIQLGVSSVSGAVLGTTWPYLLLIGAGAVVVTLGWAFFQGLLSGVGTRGKRIAAG